MRTSITIPERQNELYALAARYLTSPPREDHAKTNGQARGSAPDLSDEEIIKLCRRAKNAAKFARLFDDGDTSEYDGDDSRADQALVSLMAFYSDDPEQLDRLFRRSALKRLKWENREDYRRRTIDQALKNQSEWYKPQRKNRDEVASLLSPPYRDNDSDDADSSLLVKAFKDLPKSTKPREYVVEKLIPSGFPTTIHADGGAAKSMLTLSMGLAVARGDAEWCGHTIEKQRNVLFIDFELDEEEQSRRALQIARGEGHDDSPNGIYYLCAAGRSSTDVFTAASRSCEDLDIGLMIVDSVGVALEGDATKAEIVIEFFRKLDTFRTAGVSVLLVDHQGKLQTGDRYQGKTAFGSAYKGHLSRSRIQVEVIERHEGELCVALRQTKANFGALVDPFKIRLRFTDEMITLGREEMAEEEKREEQTLNAPDRVLLTLSDGPACASHLVEPTGLVIGTVKNSFTTLRRNGLIQSTGKPHGQAQEVRLTAAGEKRVASITGSSVKASSSSSTYKAGYNDDTSTSSYEVLADERQQTLEEELDAKGEL